MKVNNTDMGFYEIYKQYQKLDFHEMFINVSEADVKQVLSMDHIDLNSFVSLISPQAEKFIEGMAQKAQQVTLQNFGKTIQLYTPIYLSDHCDNKCIYCGFNKENDISRNKLSLEDVEREAKIIAETGLKHVLVLVGDSREYSPLSYIKECVCVMKKYFDSVSVEIYALEEDEYRQLVDIGVDGVTLYQEVYDQKKYDELHLSGPKKDYMFRLDAPERAAKAKMRTVNIGALLGLHDVRKEIFFAAVHADYLQNKFPEVEVSISVPRLTEHKGSFEASEIVTDKNIVQIILALRLFLPRVGITVSTREDAKFRENLLGLGVTKMSAGSTTAVGGRGSCQDEEKTLQFEFLDKRSVADMVEMLKTKGYQPVLKDWMKV